MPPASREGCAKWRAGPGGGPAGPPILVLKRTAGVPFIMPAQAPLSQTADVDQGDGSFRATPSHPGRLAPGMLFLRGRHALFPSPAPQMILQLIQASSSNS